MGSWVYLWVLGSTYGFLGLPIGSWDFQLAPRAPLPIGSYGFPGIPIVPSESDGFLGFPMV